MELTFNPTDFDKLVQRLKEHITLELQPIKQAAIEKPMCIKEAASYLGIHENTLYKRIRSGALPHEVIHRMDGSVYFLKSELHHLIKNS